jgi:hypothetical protein
MLSDELSQLLTAYVDGELSQRQRKAIRRVLRRSPEARAFLGQIHEDARKVRQLPPRKLAPSLVPAVLDAIAIQGLHITRPPAPVVRHRWRPYGAALVAASILIGALGGLWYLVSESEDGLGRGMGTMVAADGVPPPKRQSIESEAPPRRLPNPVIRQVVEGVYSQFAAPIPPERDPTFSVAFRDLKKNLVAERLAAELEKGQAVHLDVTVKSNALALERLHGVLEEYGIKVVVDPQAQQTMKKNPAKVEYLVYAENLRVDELTKIMRELGRDDEKLQKFQRTPFEKVTLTPLAAKEKKQVSNLLGVDVAKVEVASETKQAPTFKRWERSAVVLPPSQTARPSREVQGFVSQRRPQAGTLQVLVRIRQEK